MRETITALDIESSGFRGYPIQIGVIKENGNTYESLIKPDQEWLDYLEWDFNAQAIHNLTQEYIIENGRQIKTVAEELNNFLGEEDIFVDSQYDIMWLNLLFEFAEIKQTFRIFVLHKVLPPDFMCHWNAIFYREQKESQLQLHDALSDAKLIQRTFEKISEYF